MLPLLKKSTDNLVAVLGEKATSGESFDALKYDFMLTIFITIGRFSITWFNACILDKSGQMVIPIITKVDPIPHYSIIWAHLRINNCEYKKNSQFTINRYS